MSLAEIKMIDSTDEKSLSNVQRQLSISTIIFQQKMSGVVIRDAGRIHHAPENLLTKHLTLTFFIGLWPKGEVGQRSYNLPRE